MNRSAPLRSLGWGAAALVLGTLSIIAMAGETRVPRQLTASSELPADPQFGLSHRSATAMLERCETYLARPATRLLPTPAWRAALEMCRTQARAVAERWPTDARAWLLVASTSGELEEPTTFADALLRSQEAAPAVQWLAQRRLALADGAAATGDYSYAADVAALLESDIGARVLAATWVAGDAARRERIEAAAEAANPAMQQRLLDKIRERVASSTK